MFSSLLSVFSQDLAIDLGTANTRVYARGRGIVVGNEPSIVAVNTVTGRIEAVGTEAKDMLGRTPGNITAIRPMRDGVIADFDAAEKMLTHFIRKAHRHGTFLRPRVIIGVPSEITQVERRAVRDSAMRAESQRSAPDRGVDGGGDRRRHAHHRGRREHGGRHRRRHDGHRRHLAGGGSSTDARFASPATNWTRRIILHAKKVHNLLIGERTAEQIKINIGSAAELDTPLTMEVKGRHVIEGVRRPS